MAGKVWTELELDALREAVEANRRNRGFVELRRLATELGRSYPAVVKMAQVEGHRSYRPANPNRPEGGQ